MFNALLVAKATKSRRIPRAGRFYQSTLLLSGADQILVLLTRAAGLYFDSLPAQDYTLLCGTSAKLSPTKLRSSALQRMYYDSGEPTHLPSERLQPSRHCLF